MGRATTADIMVAVTAADITVDTGADHQRGGFGPLTLPRYSAASTAFATSAVPLLPPNSIGLMPSP